MKNKILLSALIVALSSLALGKTLKNEPEDIKYAVKLTSLKPF